MSVESALLRIRAWQEGRPLPVGRTLPWPRPHDTERQILAFIRMSGESSPWGAVLGKPGARPTVLACVEPRNPAELSRFALELWELLSRHLPFPTAAVEDDTLRAAIRERQLWLPGPSHVEMLHLLDFRFTPSRSGTPEDLLRLTALGRACGWLFRESTRPGQMRVMDATARLRSVYAFPAEDPRQQHLGFLLAWLNSVGDRDARIEAARAAERSSASTTLDPDFERDELVPRLARYHASRADPRAQARAAAAVREALEPELMRRFHLAQMALQAFDRDGRPPNTRLDSLLDLGANEFVHQYWRRETRSAASVREDEAPRFLGNHPESDFFPPAAAARYFAHLHASELAASELVHGDIDLAHAAIEAGSAFAGRLERVEERGVGRKSTPVWTVVGPMRGPLRLREESEVCVVGQPGRAGRIRQLSLDGDRRVLVVEITHGKRAPRLSDRLRATDEALEGTEVVLLAAGAAGLSLNRSRRVWDDSGPGAWLTHATPRPEPAPAQRRGSDLVEAITALEEK